MKDEDPSSFIHDEFGPAQRLATGRRATDRMPARAPHLSAPTEPGNGPVKVHLPPPMSLDEAIESFNYVKPPPISAADVMESMAATFRERQKEYGSNFRMVAPIMAILFPNGVPSDLVTSDKFHLFELIIVKLSRFAISGMTHQDSIHDLGVYAAMVEACLLEEKK